LAKYKWVKFIGQPKNKIEKIANVENNFFWIKEFDDFFDLINAVSGKVVIVLEKVSDFYNWLIEFSNYAEKYNITASDIKVCFREDKESNTGFNDWIKQKGYGGKVEEGKILIFLQKPAKWLFNDIDSVTIVTTTSFYPSPNPISRDFFNNHSCVIYLGQIKPTEKKDQRIVEL